MPDNFAKQPSNSCKGLQSSQISDSTDRDEWEDLNEEEEFFLQQVEATYKDRSFSEKEDLEERVTATEMQIEHNVGEKTAHEQDYCVEDAASSTAEMHKKAEKLDFKIKKSTDADMKKEIEGLECEEMKEEVEKLPESAEEEQAYSVEDAASYTPEMEYASSGTEIKKKESTDVDMKKEIEGLEYEEMKEEVEKLPESAEEEQAHSVGDSASYTPEMEYASSGTEIKTKQSTDADMSKEMKALQSKEIKEEIRQLQEFAEAQQNSEKQQENKMQQKEFLIDMRSVNLKTKRQRTEQEEDCKEESMKKKRKQGLPKWIAWMIGYC